MIGGDLLEVENGKVTEKLTTYSCCSAVMEIYGVLKVGTTSSYSCPKFYWFLPTISLCLQKQVSTLEKWSQRKSKMSSVRRASFSIKKPRNWGKLWQEEVWRTLSHNRIRPDQFLKVNSLPARLLKGQELQRGHSKQSHAVSQMGYFR